MVQSIQLKLVNVLFHWLISIVIHDILSSALVNTWENNFLVQFGNHGTYMYSESRKVEFWWWERCKGGGCIMYCAQYGVFEKAWMNSNTVILLGDFNCDILGIESKKGLEIQHSCWICFSHLVCKILSICLLGSHWIKHVNWFDGHNKARLNQPRIRLMGMEHVVQRYGIEWVKHT